MFGLSLDATGVLAIAIVVVASLIVTLIQKAIDWHYRVEPFDPFAPWSAESSDLREAGPRNRV